MEICGYAGKSLRVDLSKEKIGQDSLSLDLINRFLGGRGFGAKTLFDELEPRVDPFSVNNKLIISTGPFTGTLAPKGCKCVFRTCNLITTMCNDVKPVSLFDSGKRVIHT